MTEVVESSKKTTKKPNKGSPPSNVTLPPIDAEPEEIARTLFQRPPLKNRKSTPEDDCAEPDETSRA